MTIASRAIHARRFSKISIGLLFFGGLIAIKVFGLQTYVQLEFLQKHLPAVDAYIAEHFLSAIGLYLLSFITASLLSLPGSSVFLTAAGLLFNPLLGSLLAVIGATLGATGLFLLSRYVIGDSIQNKFTTQLTRVNKELEIHGSYYLLLMRILSFLPFCVINILSGFTLITLPTFIWTTALGVAPAALVYSLMGQHLRTTHTLDMLLTPYTIVLFSLFYAFKIGILYMIYKQGHARYKAARS
jgi:uncharacterized membrane protein YdjX (TVP38/TMEM64 family)